MPLGSIDPTSSETLVQRQIRFISNLRWLAPVIVVLVVLSWIEPAAKVFGEILLPWRSADPINDPNAHALVNLKEPLRMGVDCEDPDNKDDGVSEGVRCAWFSKTVKPGVRRSTMHVAFGLDTSIVHAGCSDPWRRGDILITCGSTEARTYTDFSKQGKNLSVYDQGYSASADCESDGDPITINLYALPRGCSSMRLKDGFVTIEERPKTNG